MICYDKIAKLFDSVKTTDVKIIDTEFKEEEHSRDKSGKFTSGNKSVGVSKENKKQSEVLQKAPESVIKSAENEKDFNAFVRANKTELKEAGLFNPKTAKEIFREAKYNKNIDYKEESTENAIDTIKENIPNSVLHGWFVEANSDYKTKLEDIILNSDEVRNAGLNIAFKNYKDVTGDNKMSFDEFLNKEIPVYRGKNFENFVSGDDIISYSFDKKVAESFGKYIDTQYIKPKDTLGSYQTTGEAEILIRRV